MTKSRRPHPIVQVVQTAASELNDVLNAIGLRISLLQHQVEASSFEARDNSPGRFDREGISAHSSFGRLRACRRAGRLDAAGAQSKAIQD